MTTNAIVLNWELALSIAFGLFWRWVLVGALPGVFLREVITISPWAGLALQIAISFVGLWISVKWFLGSGRIGTAKLTLTREPSAQA